MKLITKKNDSLLDAVRIARANEKIALAEAKRKAEIMIAQQTAGQHEAVLEAIRNASLGGQSVRQIGLAYGSSDPGTAKKIVQEAMGSSGGVANPHPEWHLVKREDGLFTINVYDLNGMTGSALCSLDEDGQNFSVVDGDAWIQIQLYRLGFLDVVLEEYNA